MKPQVTGCQFLQWKKQATSVFDQNWPLSCSTPGSSAPGWISPLQCLADLDQQTAAGSQQGQSVSL